MGDSNVWRFDPAAGTAVERRRDGAQPKLHRFTHVFPPSAPTSAVYDDMGVPVVDAALSGHNATILAYGQTSTGKTHTLMGTPQEPGIIILAVHDLFAAVTQALSRGQRHYELRVSYLELFNEELKDLFDPAARQLRIVEDTQVGTTVHNATEEVVRSPDQVLQLLTIGEANRAVSMTNMNARSSRSHCIVRIAIESWSAQDEREDANDVRCSVLNLVDLAGSERVSKTGATGQRMKESARINTSLLALGTVINKLTTAAEHIPYRDSKLTRLLSSSLGGDARTGIICTVSPAGWNKGETRSTLQFAERAMRITNRAAAPAPPSSATLLGRYRREIQSLRAALLEARGDTDMVLDGERLAPAEVIARLQSAHQGKEAALAEQLAALRGAEEQAQTAVSSLLELLLAASHGVAALRAAPDIVAALRDVAVGASSAPRAIRGIYASVPGLQAALEADGAGEALQHLTVASHAATQALTPEEFARQLADLQRERDELRSQTAALREDASGAQERNEELGEVVIEMQQQLTEARQQLADTQRQLRSKADEATAAERKAEQKDQRLEQAQGRSERLQQQLRQAEDALSDTVAELSGAQQAASARAASAEERLDTAQHELREKREQNKEHELRLADLRRELTDARVRVDTLQLQAEDAQRKLQVATHAQTEAGQREEQLQEQLRALQHSSQQRLEEESARAATEVRTARAAQADTQGELAAAQRQLHETKHSLDDTRARLDSTSAELQDASRRAEELAAQLAQARSAAHEAEEQAQRRQQNAEEQLATKETQLLRLQAEHAQLQEQLQATQREQQALQQALHRTQEQLASSQREQQQDQQALQQAQEQISQLHKQLQAEQSALRTLEAEHALCGGTAAEQAEQVGAASQRAETAETKAAHLSERLTAVGAELTRTTTQLSETRSRLEQVSTELSETTHKLTATTHKLETVTTERTVFHERMTRAEEQVASSHSLLLGAHSAVADMEAQVAQAEERLTTMRLAVLRAENDATRSAFSDLQDELSEAKRGASGGQQGGGASSHGGAPQRTLQSQGRGAAAPAVPVVTSAGASQGGVGQRTVSFHSTVHSSSSSSTHTSGAQGTATSAGAATPSTPAHGGVLDSSQLTPMSAVSRATGDSTPFSLSSSGTPSPQLKFGNSL